MYSCGQHKVEEMHMGTLNTILAALRMCPRLKLQLVMEREHAACWRREHLEKFFARHHVECSYQEGARPQSINHAPGAICQLLLNKDRPLRDYIIARQAAVKGMITQLNFHRWTMQVLVPLTVARMFEVQGEDRATLAKVSRDYLRTSQMLVELDWAVGPQLLDLGRKALWLEVNLQTCRH